MLLITDRVGLSAAAHRAERIVHIDDEVERREARAIGCDVRLLSFKDHRRVAGALARWRHHPDVPLTIYLDRLDLTAYALANALGATRIAIDAPERSPIARIGDASAAPHTSVQTDRTDLTPLVDAAATSLRRLFEAARARSRFDTADLGTGADALLLALKHNGIGDLVEIVRRHDDCTFQHCLLVAGLVTSFAGHLGMSFSQQHLLARAGLVHDIGKAHVPLHILNKTGPLTESEMQVMRRHAATGYYMIAHQPGFDSAILDIVRHHHEYVDGSGYPDGLRGAQISELCRLVTICDIFGALIERRAYKPRIAPRDAYAILSDMGEKIDRTLLAEFAHVVDALDKVRIAH